MELVYRFALKLRATKIRISDEAGPNAGKLARAVPPLDIVRLWLATLRTLFQKFVAFDLAFFFFRWMVIATGYFRLNHD